MITGILLCVILGACIFAAMSSAPYCEPAELKAANDAERETLRRKANTAGCLHCSAESDSDDCRRCGEIIAASIRSERRASK